LHDSRLFAEKTDNLVESLPGTHSHREKKPLVYSEHDDVIVRAALANKFGPVLRQSVRILRIKKPTKGVDLG
jgi:hypothetical protein